MESVSQDIIVVKGGNRILVLKATIIWSVHVNDNCFLFLHRMRRGWMSVPGNGFWFLSWDNVVMGLAGILRQESLEDVAETP